MVERPTPTKQLILELTGEDQGLISSAHHGLYECSSLVDVYPFLDLDETIAFSASSWKSREKDIRGFNLKVDSNDLYGIFNEVYGIGMPWLNKHKNISTALSQSHARLNPFQGKNLAGRLAKVSSPVQDKLRQQLKEGISEHVFECQYQERKMMRGGDNYKLEIMRFQNVFPKKGKIVPAFASEIAKMFKSFPREY